MGKIKQLLIKAAENLDIPDTSDPAVYSEYDRIVRELQEGE